MARNAQQMLNSLQLTQITGIANDKYVQIHAFCFLMNGGQLSACPKGLDPSWNVGVNRLQQTVSMRTVSMQKYNSRIVLDGGKRRDISHKNAHKRYNRHLVGWLFDSRNHGVTFVVV